MYILYYSPGTASLAVHWMLVELGVPFELRAIDFETRQQKDPAYLKLNPKGQVPTLLIDGTAYSESAALLTILAERHPEAGFAPAPDDPKRPLYFETMFYLANALLPAFRNWYYAPEFATPGNEDETRGFAEQRIAAAFERLDAMLADRRPFLLGERMTAPDFLATMLIRWSRNLPEPAETRPHLRDYSARMRRRPGLAQVHDKEGLAEWIRGPAETS